MKKKIKLKLKVRLELGFEQVKRDLDGLECKLNLGYNQT